MGVELITNLDFLQTSPYLYTPKPTEVSTSWDTEACTSVFMKRDGTKLWVLSNNTGVAIYEYNMIVPFDITTAEYTGNYGYVSTPTITPKHFQFKEDGTKLWVLHISRIWEYSLTTPWDITTIEFLSVYSPELLGYNANSFFMHKNMEDVWITGDDNNLRHYTLTVPGDITTLSDTGNLLDLFTVEGFGVDNPDAFVFELDGSAIHVVNAGAINAEDLYIKTWALLTSWDITTEEFAGELSNARFAGGDGLFFAGPVTGKEYLYFLRDRNYEKILDQYESEFDEFLGTIYEGTTEVDRIIRLYERDTGRFVQEVLSDSTTGEFTLTKLIGNKEYYILILDKHDVDLGKILIFDRIRGKTIFASSGQINVESFSVNIDLGT